MQILVTGSRGLVGTAVTADLEDRGHDVVGFDIADGHDVRDGNSVIARAKGCDAIVHTAAISHDDLGSATDIFMVNVEGTQHVLKAAEEAGVRRVIAFSSVQAMGVFQGEGLPEYLPLDENHPMTASRPYGSSKAAVERMCADFTTRTGIATVCLRPAAIFNSHIYEFIYQHRLDYRESEWTPFWEYGAFVDLRDVVGAVYAGLTCDNPVHTTTLLCSSDISASAPTLEMVKKLVPNVEWRGGPEYEIDPWRSLIDTSRAEHILGWKARHTWAEFLANRTTS